MTMGLADPLVEAAQALSATLAPLAFAAPVTHVYNPLDYAWAMHAQYLHRFANQPKRVIFLGMNPGPFGMVQTGIPFGEVGIVRDWLGLDAPVRRPTQENPARPIEGMACARSEVSGRRLWGLFRERFVTPEAFFAEHFVANYCPLAFFAGARNLTPDTLPAHEAAPLLAACDRHLVQLVRTLAASHVVGVGAWAHKCAARALAGQACQVHRILHPSPASPAANRDWAGSATARLVADGLWPAPLPLTPEPLHG